jgi:hypothetical protein
MERQYFVKFVRYNKITLSNLINKTVRFSTVYNFNDFNELHYLSPIPDTMTDNLRAIIKKNIIDRQRRCLLLKNIKNGNFGKNFTTELCEFMCLFRNSLFSAYFIIFKILNGFQLKKYMSFYLKCCIQ